MKATRSLTGLLAVGSLTAGGVLGLAGGSTGKAGAGVPATLASASAGCNMPTGVKHVIQITFDNLHFNRDNPNIPSDLEQIPALKDFITRNGSLLSNNHTPLIAHTADDTLTNYTGLYGDRQGMGISNDYELYSSKGIASESSFAYWTDTYGVDGYPNMPYSAKVPASGAAPASPPAPWVPFTRAACDVGDVSTSNMELENSNPDLQEVFGASSPEVAQYNADPNSFKDQETNDYLGLAVHCGSADGFCTSAQAVKYGQTSPSATAVTDLLPNEPGGYNGYQAVFGHKYLQPQLSQAATNGGNRVVGGHTYPITDSSGNLVDLNGKEIDGQYVHTPGFPGFGPISAAQSLAYVADMQEVGVPITYAYISDAHEKKSGQSGCSNTGRAQGPGDICYQQNLAAYNSAFTTFFNRLRDDGINSSNTVFVFSADEGDHFDGANVGRSVTPTCANNTAAPLGYSCSYPSGTIGEQGVNIHDLLLKQQSDNTKFYNEPQGNAVYVDGQPGPTSAATRQLERDFANATVDDVYDGSAAENVAQYEADPTVEQLLHFVNADPNRTPSFTVFPKPDFYLSSGTSDSCASGTTKATAASGCVFTNNFYAWDHGYYAPEINNTWLGLVGPGVAIKGIDGSSAAAGPNSSGTANSSPQLDTQVANQGTWADHTDIRPTILALTGLTDDYTTDGRVLTEDLTIAPGVTGTDPNFQQLAECYKQLNSSVGKFGTDVLVADTTAVKTGSPADDSSYMATSTEIQKLGAQRDTLAAQIKGDLAAAEFGHTAVPPGDYESCQSLLRQADNLAGGGA